MTQRIEPFFQFDSKNWTFCLFQNVTQRIELLNSFTNMAYSKNSTLLNLFIWLNELDLFYMTQRIEPYWIITQRIESSFSWLWIEYFLWSKELYFLCWMWSKELNLFCWMWPKELNHCWKTWRIDPFCKYDWELNPFWTFSYDSKKWTFFDMTQRIKLFCMWLKELKFLYKKWVQEWIFRMWLKELKFFNMTQRIEIDSHNWTSLFSNMTHRFFFSDSQIFLIWLTELNTFFSKWLIELNIFFSKWLKGLIFSKVTQRIELIFWKYNPQDWTFSLIWSKERIEILWYDTKDWIFLIWLTEPNTFQHNSKNWTFFSNWLKEVNFFLQLTQRSELFIWQNMTQRFDFFWYDSKNRTHFWMWLKELNLFFWTWFKELNPLHKRTPRIDFFTIFFQRFEPFLTWLTELSPFWTIWLIEIEPFFSTWVKENNSFFVWLKDFLLFCKMYDSKNELIVLGKYDSENWNFWKKNGL